MHHNPEILHRIKCASLCGCASTCSAVPNRSDLELRHLSLGEVDPPQGYAPLPRRLFGRVGQYRAGHRRLPYHYRQVAHHHLGKRPFDQARYHSFVIHCCDMGNKILNVAICLVEQSGHKYPFLSTIVVRLAMSILKNRHKEQDQDYIRKSF